MRRGNDWLTYLQTLSEPGRDLTHHANIYAHQWAHDVRCLRQGSDHRRVGEAMITDHGWLEAGLVTRLSSRKPGQV